MKSKIKRSSNPLDNENKKGRVFARLLCRQVTEEESKEISGGENGNTNGNGRWYFTDTKKFTGWDWEPN